MGIFTPRWLVGKVKDAYTVAASDTDSKIRRSANYECDGTGDQVEIQAAIDALGSSGGTVHLQAGTYNLSAAIVLAANNITIEGKGRGATTIQLASTTDDNAIRWPSNLSGITLRNLTISGNRTTMPTRFRLYSSNCTSGQYNLTVQQWIPNATRTTATTGNMDYNASAATVQATLEALSNVGATGVVCADVDGGPGVRGGYMLIAFQPTTVAGAGCHYMLAFNSFSMSSATPHFVTMDNYPLVETTKYARTSYMQYGVMDTVDVTAGAGDGVLQYRPFLCRYHNCHFVSNTGSGFVSRYGSPKFTQCFFATNTGWGFDGQYLWVRNVDALVEDISGCSVRANGSATQVYKAGKTWSWTDQPTTADYIVVEAATGGTLAVGSYAISARSDTDGITFTTGGAAKTADADSVTVRIYKTQTIYDATEDGWITSSALYENKAGGVSRWNGGSITGTNFLTNGDSTASAYRGHNILDLQTTYFSGNNVITGSQDGIYNATSCQITGSKFSSCGHWGIEYATSCAISGCYFVANNTSATNKSNLGLMYNNAVTGNVIGNLSGTGDGDYQITIANEARYGNSIVGNVLNCGKVGIIQMLATGTSIQGNATYNQNGLTIPEQVIVYAKNVSGGAVPHGSVVIFGGTANSMEFTTSTTDNDTRVFGVVVNYVSTTATDVAANAVCAVLVRGTILNTGGTGGLRVDGTADIAAGSYLKVSNIAAGVAELATTGDIAFAIAREAYATDDANGRVKADIIPLMIAP